VSLACGTRLLRRKVFELTERQPASNRTALGVAELRAVHQFLDGEPKILEDPAILRLLGADAVARLKSDSAPADRPQRRGLRADVLWRTRYAEERLAQAVERGLRQCVILGAGLDTFAYRQPDWARSLRIYEIDHPAAQQDKRRRLTDAAIAMPDNLEFVPIDFEAPGLSETLRGSTLDFRAPAFFTCLGVLVYLTRRAVDAAFHLVAAFPPGSELVFTFSPPENAGTPLAARLAERGEPWLTHFAPQALADELRARGFSQIPPSDIAEAEQNCFHGRGDGLQPARVETLAAAIVGERP
jgi:methyltransferase (TIGR00027 family)